MSWVRTLTLYFLSTVLIASLTLTVMGLGLKTLLYPEVYEQALARNEAYNEIEQLMTENIPVMVPIDVEENTKRLLRNALAYFRGEREELDLVVMFDEGAIIEEYESLPACIGNEIPGIDCRLRDVPGEIFIEEVKDALGFEGEELVIDLKDEAPMEEIEIVRRSVSIFWTALYSAMATAAFSAFMIVFLGWKTKHGFVRWLDTDLFLVGGTMFFFSRVMKHQIDIRLTPDVVPIEAVADVFKDIMNTVLGIMEFYGFILLGAGLLLLVVSFIYHLANRKEEQHLYGRTVSLDKKKKKAGTKQAITSKAPQQKKTEPKKKPDKPRPS